MLELIKILYLKSLIFSDIENPIIAQILAPKIFENPIITHKKIQSINFKMVKKQKKFDNSSRLNPPLESFFAVDNSERSAIN